MYLNIDYSLWKKHKSHDIDLDFFLLNLEH